jgi:hypothetical protein
VREGTKDGQALGDDARKGGKFADMVALTKGVLDL